MRARFTLNLLNIPFEIVEVDLKNKPKELFELSPKATVPVLHLEDGTVIDESLDIVKWAISNKPNIIIEGSYNYTSWLEKFIPNLNRHKYPNRYSDVTGQEIDLCIALLKELDISLKNADFLGQDKISIADVAIFPFIRQFMKVDEDGFKTLDITSVHNWLNNLLSSPAFITSMKKTGFS